MSAAAQKRCPAWSDCWLRKRTWREIQTMIRLFDVRESREGLSRIEQARKVRMHKEWTRRKSEGGGGMAAS